MIEPWVVPFVWRSSPLSFFVITLWGQALKQQQPNLGIHQAKLNQGLRDMTNTLIRRWKGNMNALSVFWGCESQYRQAVVTGSVRAVLYGPYGKVYESLTNISWTPWVEITEHSFMTNTRSSSLLDRIPNDFSNDAVSCFKSRSIQQTCLVPCGTLHKHLIRIENFQLNAFLQPWTTRSTCSSALSVPFDSNL